MSKTVISVEHLTKRYDLGVITTGTLSRDLNRWWARVRGKPDPYLKVGQADYGNRSGDSILALNDVSFQVQQGETLGIIGRNGAGKSTLLKILSRVTAPTSGKVKINGRVGSLLEVGTGFHPELTGRENIYLNGAILGMSRKEVDRKFDEIVDFSGVEQFINTPVKRYSSGMYVRLAFAVAAHLQTNILVVDEVLAVGDAEFQQKCLGKMDDVAHEGQTVLFVSHNMGSIQQLTSRCILLSNSAIACDSSPYDAISMYLNISESKVNDFFQTENRLLKIRYFGLNTQYPQPSYNIPINLKLDIILKNSYEDIRVSLHFTNSLNSNILASWADLHLTECKKDPIVLNLNIPDHNLPPGNYRVTLVINLKGHDTIRFVDCYTAKISDVGNNDINLSKRGDTLGTFVPLDISYI